MSIIHRIRRKLSSRPEWPPAARYALIVLVLLAAPLALALAAEYIQRNSVSQTLAWVSHNTELFGLNALILLFILGVIYGLIGSLLPALGVTALLIFLASLINYFKLKLIGEPFFPWDIFLNKEGMNIFPLISNRSAIIRLVLLSIVVATLFLLRFYLPRFKLPILARIGLGIVAVFAMYSFCMRSPWANKLYAKAGVSEVVWDQKVNYKNNGLALAFTLNVRNVIVAKPQGYSDAAMAAVAKQIQAQYPASVPAGANLKGGKKPNVIFIMNEAFWDPTLLPGVKYNEDPVPTIHQLQKEATSGFLLSPQFGGGTSNVEFEVLTGNSMSFLPAGSIPYQQYIKHPLPSLASYFKTQGYVSKAIHPYEGWFWNRINVYKELGFDSFRYKDNFTNPEVKGFYISDDEVSRSIINETDKSADPVFIYAVTMQNHGPYSDMRYGKNAIQAEGKFTADAKKTLETYTHGAHDADASLKLLIDHYKQSDEPTVIVFYGDHLPMLGYDYGVYVQGGLIPSANTEQWSLEQLKSMHSVPFVAWSNYALPQQHMPVISNSFLGSYILDWIGMDLPAQFAYDAMLSKKTPGLLRNLVVDSNQKLYPAVPDTLKNDVLSYQQIQYDIMFGSRNLAKYLDHDYLTKPEVPTYNKEFEKPAGK
jgi:phosphoglycerol transferase MdoB-like AlkP superfamily enzyme